jgi:transcription-repair coupling factor (superfamily II helicase)
MYQKILDEALMELKETEFSDLFPVTGDKEYAKDCVIETDLGIMIPDHYITNITERLNIYKELDSIDTEENLTAFRERLIDRFGPVPEPTEALISTIRLRWLARKIGFEKLVLRNNRLTAFFISNSDSAYFQSSHFTRILDYLKSNSREGKLKQENDRLSLILQNVSGVEQAIRRIAGITAEIQ